MLWMHLSGDEVHILYSFLYRSIHDTSIHDKSVHKNILVLLLIYLFQWKTSLTISIIHHEKSCLDFRHSIVFRIRAYVTFRFMFRFPYFFNMKLSKIGPDHIHRSNTIQSINSLMVGIGGTSFLARDSKNRIHVVVTHVGSLGRDVFRAKGDRKVFLVHCGSREKRRRYNKHY